MSAKVHILGPTFSSFVRSVMLCCEEKGISYETKFEIDGQPLSLNDETHLQYHPFGKIPALIHGERSVFETATICRYLDATFDGPALQPTDIYQRAEVDEWAAALSIYVDKAIVRQYLLEFAFPKGPEGQVRLDKVTEAEPEVARMLSIVEKQLGDNDFICGSEYTYADAILTPMLDYLSGTPNATSLMPNNSVLMDYLLRMRARPSAVNALTSDS
ncbi:glutathione S-transferase family protein [Pontibacterium granulatum]|uniref:glutathione S-transferase family protein n=1 Tax=Pontibacterium granulatum TaxID=2036029 RepID=UPI00249CCB09|nr:glutathione S-transferase family protein [Pontibacterium granulatum]MDI3324073.1 glutathione S-transferase family protein [Pontibacterium granulatum]